MILIRSRLGFVVASLAVAFICWAVVYLPPYEKIVYEKNPIVSQEEYDKRFGIVIGYKGGTNIKKIYSVDDIRDEKGFTEVIVEIDTEKLEPTGIYQCINDVYQLGDIEKSSVKVFFDRTIKKYGQYYIASLESGEKIPVFIDDSLINMRKKGIIQLPIGVANISKVDFSQYNVQSGYEDLYLDCASGFATGPEMQDFRFMEKMAVLVIIVVMVVFLGIVLGINIGNSRK